MSLSRFAGWFRPYSVPICLFVVVAATVLFVPPLVLGEVTGRTYALTIAVLIVAVSSVLPYAVAVAILTVPVPYAGLGSYAAPAAVESFSPTAALRHVVAGVSYAVAATAVGGVSVGIDFAVSSGSSPLQAVRFPALGVPPFLTLGGAAVAAVYVAVQLWRYDSPLAEIGLDTVLGTVGLGVLLAASPVAALWLFGAFGF
ncbi:hypothetical protein SAMN05443574_10851 [Haloarcula vallismortis]|uniref:Yip1 domain-containing protein n=2 Tax=Haloarcula vallismortis TaxID=28442 RepID=M0JD09_HALVA|nr:hypothetical protein [Haloarcula vallismortis]EMA05545.1 hypothetical protein C437_12865 [Haloarcula vallismortis ATCC 29715]SDW86209.1 hypothetical protein SAMN05443574_10851 [Haloarcula vallismortis]